MDERPYYKVIKIKEKEEWPFLVIYAASPIEGEDEDSKTEHHKLTPDEKEYLHKGILYKK